MTRINTNVPSLLAQRTLNMNQSKLNTSLTRLSTGLKINTGADNPAGLIASENLRAEKVGITQAIDNAERAGNIIGTAEGGLSEVSSLLNELQALVSASANKGGLSSEELDANQLQVDSIIETIDRLAGSTAFQGQKLLDGTYAYQTSSIVASAFEDVRVNAAKIPDGAFVGVTVDVTASAEKGRIDGPNAAINTSTTIEVKGVHGSELLSFANGTALADVETAINNLTQVTGVEARISGGQMILESEEYGSDQFVSVSVIDGTFATSAPSDYGEDVTATVNGVQASSRGLNVQFRSAQLDVELDLTEEMGNMDATLAGVAGFNAFEVTGGGAQFSLGAKVNENDKAGIGLLSISSGSLGTVGTGYLSSLKSGGPNDVRGNTNIAGQRVLDEAIKQVSTLRGRLGAFQKFTIGSTVNALGVAFENASAAESAIRDTDFAEETSNLTRMQILSQSATSALSQANTSPQLALQLLG